nr:prostamide/prostaglandin F synthase-like [Cherax quadricarinatus]
MRKVYRATDIIRRTVNLPPSALPTLNLHQHLCSKFSKEWAVGGDMKGDGFQNGGLLVVGPKGEKVLYEFKQENPAEHAENSAIAKALGLEITPEAGKVADGTNLTDLECEEVCAMPSKK